MQLEVVHLVDRNCRMHMHFRVIENAFDTATAIGRMPPMVLLQLGIASASRGALIVSLQRGEWSPDFANYSHVL